MDGDPAPSFSDDFSPRLATNKYNLKTLRSLMSGRLESPASPSMEGRIQTNNIQGAAPLGAPLITAVHNKLKSVGANTVLVQG